MLGFKCVSSSNEVREFSTHAQALRFVLREGNKSRLWSLEQDAVATVADLIHEAGMLNNNAKLVNTDHVSIMGLMNHTEMLVHVARLRDMAA